MIDINIINKDNEKGTILETYGSCLIIPKGYIRLVVVLLCMLTIGTNWIIPLVCRKVKDIKIRHNRELPFKSMFSWSK